MSRTNPIHLALPAAATSLALSAACALGVWSLGRLQADRARLLAQEVAGLEAAQEAEVRLRQVRLHALVYVLEPTPARWAPLDGDHRQFEAAIQKAVAAATGPEELRLIGEVRAGYAAYRRGLGVRPPVALDRAAVVAWSDAHPVGPILASCEELVERNRASLEATALANESLTDRTRLALGLVGVLGPLAGLAGGVGLARAWGRRWDRQRRELARAEQMAAVGHLAAGVAHEVRNPLTGMKLLVQAALRPGRPAEVTPDELRMMLDDIGRVERTVQGLLDFAKPPGARQTLDAAEAVRRVAERECGRAGAKNVTVGVEVAAGGLLVSADPDAFASLVSNLVINAVEASPSGGTVAVSVGRAEGRLTITVEDDGPGVAPAMLGRLFDPFATDKPGGTGLGLSTARRLAREHGGDVTAEGKPGGGGGARFAVTLPLVGG